MTHMTRMTVTFRRSEICDDFQVVLLSNAGFYLGKMLAEGRNTTAVVATLTALATRRVRDTGRQLAGR
ncbi:hypothetical protein Y032_0032g2612 [Ancylostoma ceylanicum]|uniref:Uncharacterized protein n=1 Tax=Ancylostoma ceylanicum TaxID=53326 RepID=A0A016UNN3_9BILA|nr:hypothetical protein Y032_0032g2612 [Ancylostoma ceylanicum]